MTTIPIREVATATPPDVVAREGRGERAAILACPQPPLFAPLQDVVITSRGRGTSWAQVCRAVALGADLAFAPPQPWRVPLRSAAGTVPRGWWLHSDASRANAHPAQDTNAPTGPTQGRKHLPCLMLALLLGGALTRAHAAVMPPAALPPSVTAYVKDHCLDCHDADSARAGFRIDTVSADFTVGDTAAQWKEIMDRISGGEMPPKKKARPDAKASYAVTSWIAGRLKQTDDLAMGAGGRVPLRRMNRVEYANTVRDLFSLEEGFARRVEKELPADGKVGGFDRGAAGLFMDEGQLGQYLAVAELVLDDGVFLAKPEVQHLTWDARAKQFIHGIGVCHRDATGKVVNDNPPPGVAATIAEPLSEITVDQTDGGKEKRYVAHGVYDWAVKGDGIEYLSGGSNYRNPGNLRSPFCAWDWGQKGVTRDGWYRLRFKAGAFVGRGKEAQSDVRLQIEYAFGTPIEVVKTVVIDAPLDAPKDYEVMMYLQSGPPGMNHPLEIGWDNGDKSVAVVNPAYEEVQWKPVLVAQEIQRAQQEKQSAEAIATVKRKSEEALAAALQSRRTFAGPMFVFNPKLVVADRPRLWLGTFSFEGPITEWPPHGRTTLLFAGETRSDAQYLREIFARFLPKAYRRPALPVEVAALVAWVQKQQADRHLVLADAVRVGVKNVLCSPAFLYLGAEAAEAADGAEHRPQAKAGPQALDDWQLASRLSYLLWSSAPDEVLTALASKGQLHRSEALRAQVTRMLGDPRAREFTRNFAGQWLGVRNFDNGTAPNRDVYREYDDRLRDSSKREPLEFFHQLLTADLPITAILDSDFIVVDERLARHYGIPGVIGEQFRRVPAPADGRRGGVLGMTGILTYLADGTRTLPVRRATWLLDTLWNQQVPPPPPNAGALPAIKGKTLSVRDRLDAHRASDNCASCHTRVDPFGLALENYDAVGKWRDRQNGEGMNGDDNAPALVIGGQLPDGTAFATVQEFKAALRAHQETFLKAFAEKLLCYALTRPIAYGDHTVVDQIVAHAKAHGLHLQEIIQATVASPFFQTR